MLLKQFNITFALLTAIAGNSVAAQVKAYDYVRAVEEVVFGV